jgi:Ca2+-binding RTX toxin-like protein
LGNGLDNLIYMNGNTGGCSIDGALGTDTLSYYNAAVAGATSGVNMNLGGTQNASGYVTASGTFGADLIKGIENLIGSAYADTFTGNSSANVLDGGQGNDTLAGWLGKDTLTGGSGADKFLFNVLETTANRDTITDFLVSEGDKIQFSKSVFTGFANVLNGTITTAMLAVDGAAPTTSTRLIYSSTTGVLSYDADGSGAGQAVEVALIGVTTHATLNTTHFEIVA